uniref:Probable assembly chaperone of rpl4 n=1 Tax=Crassostrea virginica TaxID=6565 RepID=A0A8B8CEP9_CRAVI|nr:probable assembly chaperone of rpl4 [Crassostrea virginica]
MGKKNFKKKAGASLVERKKNLQEARKELAKSSSSTKTKTQYSVDQILDKVEEYIDSFQYELAQKFCQRALEMEPDNLRALETAGSLLLELGNTEAAKQCFGRAVEVKPDAGHSKYMYLGQLFEGAEAIQFFQKGIELMVKEREAQSAQELAAACGGDEKISGRDISSAYCSLAEIYMTDCCDEPNAESECETAINKAIETDGENPEAYQLKASFYLSKDNKKEALSMIKKSVSLWLPRFEAVDQGIITEEDSDPVEVVPLSYDVRVSAAKILTEVEEFETAVTVLEGLLDENEDDAQLWYMIGWANFLQGEDYKSNARYYLKKCKEVYAKAKCDDEGILNHTEELLGELGPGDNDDDERMMMLVMMMLKS